MPNFLPGSGQHVARPLNGDAAFPVLSFEDPGNAGGAGGDGNNSDASGSAGLAPGDALSDNISPFDSPVGVAADRAVLGNFARSVFGVTGAGISVGILSDSFNRHAGYAADIASGALPAGVQVLSEGPANGSDEGRAMAELVHQEAPDAKLLFHTAFNSEADFAAGIRELAAAGAKVIVDDVTYAMSRSSSSAAPSPTRSPASSPRASPT